jgi:PIN domain nuclease of toxin-antitoxin system
MVIAVADTHAAIWYLSADKRLSTSAKSFLDSAQRSTDQIAISAITLVEMVYLIEKGRIPAQRFSQLVVELNDPDSMFIEIPVDLRIARALSQVNVAQIPDMPDRIIAATGIAYAVPIISRDAKILHSGINTLW